MTTEHFDVLIVGAGLSGVGAGAHLRRNCPGKTYAILEMRESMGGTWDLFRYPGIRSDSDMFTLGFVFRPWTESKAIAEECAKAGVGWTSGAHTGLPVLTTSKGVKAEIFTGFINNYDIAIRMKSIL